MKSIDIATVRLILADPARTPPSAHLLRGAIASLFGENSLFHQHDSGGLLYRYPKIHYRWDSSGPFVLGFGEGVRALLDLPWPGLSLRIGQRSLNVLEVECSFQQHEIRPTERLVRYRFGSPWIPFNQENHARYRTMSPEEQAAERDRLAVAGLLMGLRGIGIDVDYRLYASFEMRVSRPCPYKDVSLTGFLGTLLANLDLPDGLAIGRAVSHGYGWFSAKK